MTKIVEQIVLFLNFQCKKTCQKIFFRRITIFLLTYDSNDSNEYCIRRSSHFFAVVLLASPPLCAFTARNVHRFLPLSLSFSSIGIVHVVQLHIRAVLRGGGEGENKMTAKKREPLRTWKKSRNSVKFREISRNYTSRNSAEFRRNCSQFRTEYGIDGSKKNRRNSVSAEFRGHPTGDSGDTRYTL
jgi:hypothetical protein